jgi:uncharacterized membrane protein YdcZ (DUF606 family)
MSSLDFVLLGALAVIVGALIPVQAATNAAMSRLVGTVAITSLALLAIGFVVVCSLGDRHSRTASVTGNTAARAGRWLLWWIHS